MNKKILKLMLLGIMVSGGTLNATSAMPHSGENGEKWEDRLSETTVNPLEPVSSGDLDKVLSLPKVEAPNDLAETTTRLSLFDKVMDRDALDVLIKDLEEGKFPNLTSLELGKGEVTPFFHAMKSGMLQKLKELYVRSPLMDRERVLSLSEAIQDDKLPELTTLWISSTMAPEEVAILFKFVENGGLRKLENLNLLGSAIRLEGTIALFELIQKGAFPCLTKLDLACSDLTYDVGTAFIKAATEDKLSNLVSLCLDDCKINFGTTVLLDLAIKFGRSPIDLVTSGWLPKLKTFSIKGGNIKYKTKEFLRSEVEKAKGNGNIPADFALYT